MLKCLLCRINGPARFFEGLEVVLQKVPYGINHDKIESLDHGNHAHPVVFGPIGTLLHCENTVIVVHHRLGEGSGEDRVRDEVVEDVLQSQGFCDEPACGFQILIEPFLEQVNLLSVVEDSGASRRRIRG